MNLYGLLIVLHLLGASVWVGGHLVLACSVLPKALRTRDADAVRRYEEGYERVGIPALIVQVITGIWLSHMKLPDPSMWFDFSNPVGRLIGIKLILLAATIGLALDARLRIIPKLKNDNLVSLAWHIVPVTLVAVLFLVVGASFRIGWLY